MSRHSFDDFSFLPTVDSTGEEVVEPGHAGHHPPQPESTEPIHEEVAEPIAAEEPVYEEVEVPHEPPVFVQAPMADMPVSEVELHAEHSSAEDEEFIEARHKELEPPSASVQPPQQARELPKLEDDVSHAPEAVRQSAAHEEKQSKVASSNELPRSEDEVSDTAKGKEEPRAAKDSKPFIAPKSPPEEPLDPEQAKKQRWQKLADKIGLRTLGMSFGVHLFLLLIAAFVGVSQVMDRQVDFLPGGSSAQSQAAAAELTHKIQTKKNPWLKAKPPMRKITVQTLSSNIVMPEMPAMDMMDFSQINNRMDLSKAPSMGSSQPMGLGGAGGGFGAGIGRGGKFSFVGQTAVGSRVVFVVDLSSSMSQPLKGDGPRTTRFELLKKELIKAVKQIPYGTAYQVLYFSDFAWPHNQVDSRNEEALEKYHWEIKAEEYKQAKIPTFKYIQATQFTLQDSVDIIQRSDNNRIYTNWGAGLLMALNANPKPDVIFFMTDGERKDEQGWIDIVTNENKRKLPMSVIHTSVMAQVDAAFEIDALAKRNNGSFTVVTDDGRVIKGEDYFKMK
jgi:Na+-transporting methylmalonyl-CoA/oxaloacetate decarboxylase gamma subunit